ncbi:MAG: PAS domain S-box protein, partial [Haloferacaceae archaeon]
MTTDRAPVAVLYVDDDPARADRVASRLREEALVVATTDATDVLDAIRTAAPDCVVAEYDLAATDGVELLRSVRSAHPDLPFVLYTGSGSEAVAGEAIAAGVSAYVPADGDGISRLAERVRGSVADAATEGDDATGGPASEHDGSAGVDTGAGRNADWAAVVQEYHPDADASDRAGRMFHRAVEAAGHSIYFTTPGGTITYVNPAFETTTGYSAEEAIGATPRILKSGEHGQEFYERLWDTILSGQVWRSEIVNRRKDGETYAVDQTIAPVLDDADEVVCFVAVNVDITEKREYEQAIERQNERLDEFVNIVSHDLRNPLAVAGAWLEQAREERDSEALAKVARAHDRMEALIDDLLALAQLGDEAFEVTTVDLRTVAERAWEHVDTGEAQLRVTAEGQVRADRRRLLQALENLFCNAVDHGGDDVTVT